MDAGQMKRDGWIRRAYHWGKARYEAGAPYREAQQEVNRLVLLQHGGRLLFYMVLALGLGIGAEFLRLWAGAPGLGQTVLLFGPLGSGLLVFAFLRLGRQHLHPAPETEASGWLPFICVWLILVQLVDFLRFSTWLPANYLRRGLASPDYSADLERFQRWTEIMQRPDMLTALWIVEAGFVAFCLFLLARRLSILPGWAGPEIHRLRDSARFSKEERKTLRRYLLPVLRIWAPALLPAVITTRFILMPKIVQEDLPLSLLDAAQNMHLESLLGGLGYGLAYGQFAYGYGWPEWKITALGWGLSLMLSMVALCAMALFAALLGYGYEKILAARADQPRPPAVQKAGWGRFLLWPVFVGFLFAPHMHDITSMITQLDPSVRQYQIYAGKVHLPEIAEDSPFSRAIRCQMEAGAIRTDISAFPDESGHVLIPTDPRLCPLETPLHQADITELFLQEGEDWQWLISADEALAEIYIAHGHAGLWLEQPYVTLWRRHRISSRTRILPFPQRGDVYMAILALPLADADAGEEDPPLLLPPQEVTDQAVGQFFLADGAEEREEKWQMQPFTAGALRRIIFSPPTPALREALPEEPIYLDAEGKGRYRMEPVWLWIDSHKG